MKQASIEINNDASPQTDAGTPGKSSVIPSTLSSEPDSVSALPLQPGHNEASAAAQSLLQAPLDAVESAPLEQVALARSYLSWRRRNGNTNGNEKRLAGRIELAIQGHPTSSPASSAIRDRRFQHALRAALDKIVANRIDSMTFRELELVTSSYAILVQRSDRSASEERMLGLLAKAVSELERLLLELPVRG